MQHIIKYLPRDIGAMAFRYRLDRYQRKGGHVGDRSYLKKNILHRLLFEIASSRLAAQSNRGGTRNDDKTIISNKAAQSL